MNKENLQNLIDKAGEMARSNSWGEDAYEINMAILEIDDNNCAAYTRLAKYYKLNNNFDEAKNMYFRTLEIDPKNWGAVNNLNDIEKDEKESETVAKMKTTKELLKEGQTSMLKGRYRIAVKIYAKVFDNEPILTNAVNLANAYKKLGKYDLIEKLYEQLIADNRKKADIKAINEEFKTLRLDNKCLTK